MKLTKSAGWLAGALGGLALTGCIGAEDGADNDADDAIDATPASLVQGRAELEKIDRIMTERGSTDTLVQQERQIRARLEALSGRVDSIDVASDHSITFFALPNGEMMVSERMKVGVPSAMKGNSTESIESIYQRLAPGRSIPTALTNRPPVTIGDVGTTQLQNDVETVSSAITDSAADDQWFRDNACKSGNVKSFCFIHRTGSNFSEATSDHSQVNGAFTRGTGSINLNFGAGGGASPTFTQAILPGEFHFFWWVGPWHDVRDSGCLPWPFACGTHREAQKRFKRWAIAGSTTKTHDLGGMFYNKPLSWNSM